jgi:hypothetical protein
MLINEVTDDQMCKCVNFYIYNKETATLLNYLRALGYGHAQVATCFHRE